MFRWNLLSCDLGPIGLQMIVSPHSYWYNAVGRLLEERRPLDSGGIGCYFPLNLLAFP